MMEKVAGDSGTLPNLFFGSKGHSIEDEKSRIIQA
jgi:hypothetical protein